MFSYNLSDAALLPKLNLFSLQREKHITREEGQLSTQHASSCIPRTIILGFSKGGVVLNQLVTELGYSDIKCTEDLPKPASFPGTTENQIVPLSRESFLDSITEIHYVDVGLNSPGAYVTDGAVIERIAKQLIERDKYICFVLHGTPRQWSDIRRPWIREEKDKFRQILACEGQKSNGKLKVYENTYFSEVFPSLQMHFEIIEQLVVS